MFHSWKGGKKRALGIYGLEFEMWPYLFLAEKLRKFFGLSRCISSSINVDCNPISRNNVKSDFTCKFLKIVLISVCYTRFEYKILLVFLFCDVSY